MDAKTFATIWASAGSEDCWTEWEATRPEPSMVKEIVTDPGF